MNSDDPAPDAQICAHLPVFMIDDIYVATVGALKHHIDLCSIPQLPTELEADTAPHPTKTDTVRFLYTKPFLGTGRTIHRRIGPHPPNGEQVSAKQPTVAEYLDALDHPRIDDIRRIRTALVADDAELGERIKWNAPSFGHDGDDRVTFRLQPGDRFELVLHRGVQRRSDPFVFDDPDNLIVWATNDRGAAVVPAPLADDDEARLLALARRWLVATR